MHLYLAVDASDIEAIARDGVLPKPYDELYPKKAKIELSGNLRDLVDNPELGEKTYFLRVNSQDLNQGAFLANDFELAIYLDEIGSDRNWSDVPWQESLAIVKKCSMLEPIKPEMLQLLDPEVEHEDIWISLTDLKIGFEPPSFGM